MFSIYLIFHTNKLRVGKAKCIPKNDTSTGRVSIQLSLALRATSAGLYSKFSSSSSSLPQNISSATCPLWRLVGAFQSRNRVTSADSTLNEGVRGGGHHLSPKNSIRPPPIRAHAIGNYEAEQKSQFEWTKKRGRQSHSQSPTTMNRRIRGEICAAREASPLTPNLDAQFFFEPLHLSPLLAQLVRFFSLFFSRLNYVLFFFFHSLFCQF